MKKALNKKQKEGVREWLKNKQYNNCPFHIISEDCPICKSWFPRSDDDHCPCEVYPINGVIKRAIKMVETRKVER